MKIRHLANKIFLSFAGFLAAVILVEVLLRTAGFALLLRQKYRNAESLRGSDEIRILCLGESTTQNQYPRVLEGILNSAEPSKKFAVIDGGLAGTNSGLILSKLEKQLDEYRPEAVVAMIGINDQAWSVPLEESADAQERLIEWFMNLRIVKLHKLCFTPGGQKETVSPMVAGNPKARNVRDVLGHLWRRVSFTRPIQDDESLPDVQQNKQRKENLGVTTEIPRDWTSFVKLGSGHLQHANWWEADKCFREALNLSPRNEWVCISVGNAYKERAKTKEAKRWFQRAVEINPKNETAYIELGHINEEAGNWEEAEANFRKAVEISPRNPITQKELGNIYEEIGNQDEAVKCYQKMVEINPSDHWGYVRMGHIYWYRGEREKADNFYRQAADAEPRNAEMLLRLGYIYWQRRIYDFGGDPGSGKPFRSQRAISFDMDGAAVTGDEAAAMNDLEQARKLFLRALELDPQEIRGFPWLGSVCLQLGKIEEAKRWGKIAIERAEPNSVTYNTAQSLLQLIRSGRKERPDIVRAIGSKLDRSLNSRKENDRPFYRSVTVDNYRKIRDIVLRRKIKLICVQYPRWPLSPLIDVIGPRPGVFFVDNEKSFNEAVEKDGYASCFVDRLDDLFGHCTKRGNRLLAENIARVIASKVYGDSAKQ